MGWDLACRDYFTVLRSWRGLQGEEVSRLTFEELKIGQEVQM